ncbi:VanZ family protein [Halobacillus massiliensis]|uniref:VanZ family protein n=1 Tax=Halobacillus massiliensis TaxID=1926286 RepID=UPI0009E2BF63|nr:VanZ family protein [Halobacillus massiliensis]
MTVNGLFESLHIIEFAILYVLLLGALKANRKLSMFTSVLAALFAMLYGMIDEIHQLFVPGRSFTVNDLMKDWIGVAAAFIIVHVFFLKNKIVTESEAVGERRRSSVK